MSADRLREALQQLLGRIYAALAAVEREDFAAAARELDDAGEKLKTLDADIEERQKEDES